MNVRTPRWGARIVVTSFLLMVLAGATPGTQAVLPTELSLAGPTHTNTYDSFHYEGMLTLDGNGMPLQDVKLLLDGTHVATGTTDLDGRYTISFTLPARGLVEVVAVALEGTIQQVESEPIDVLVGPGELSVAGPAEALRRMSLDYSGHLTLTGTPLSGQTVQILSDGTPVGTDTTDPDGAYDMTLEFPKRGFYELEAVAFNDTPAETFSDSLTLEVEPFTQISAGGAHTCALVIDGTLRCWGAGGSGQLGDGSGWRALRPVAVSGITDAVDITVGDGHSCALLADGTVRCWGHNGWGQVGDGSSHSSMTPVVVSGLTGVVQIAAGGSSTCAVREDGSVYCWGRHHLSDGSSEGWRTPVAMTTITDAIAVTVGGGHKCALLAQGGVDCWGSNWNGEVGDGTTEHRGAPVPVVGVASAVAIAAGSSHSCALFGDGTARCWGSNIRGQIGDGTKTLRATPVSVSGLTTAVALIAGGSQTCARLDNGTAQCWGNNAVGQVGDGTTTQRLVPTAVSGLNDVVVITAGSNTHSCAALADGSGHCWGKNWTGEIGDGSLKRRLAPVEVF